MSVLELLGTTLVVCFVALLAYELWLDYGDMP